MAAVESDKCYCEQAGKWGATGRMPPGHFWHWRNDEHTSGYLAHIPLPRPRKQYKFLYRWEGRYYWESTTRVGVTDSRHEQFSCDVDWFWGRKS